MDVRMSRSLLRRPAALWAILGLVIVLAASAGVGAQGLPKEVDDWLREVQIGPYLPESIDWDAVYEAAKKEGKVVIYTSSSRTISLKEEFESLYPGVTMEVYELGSTGSIEKLFREQQAKVYNADVIHASGYPGAAAPAAPRAHDFPLLSARAGAGHPQGVPRSPHGPAV